MFRKIVKGFTMVVIFLDFIYMLTLDPSIALIRIVFLIGVVWAWKLY